MNVIGPISEDHWGTMRLLKGSINYYRGKNNEKQLRALKMEKELYADYLREAVKRPANDNVAAREAA